MEHTYIYEEPLFRIRKSAKSINYGERDFAKTSSENKGIYSNRIIISYLDQDYKHIYSILNKENVEFKHEKNISFLRY